MRLDKYLKITRLIKRRTIAKEACDAGRVLIGEKPARASYEVKIGDRITIQLGSHLVMVEVVKISEYATKETAASLYNIISTKDKE